MRDQVQETTMHRCPRCGYIEEFTATTPTGLMAVTSDMIDAGFEAYTTTSTDDARQLIADILTAAMPAAEPATRIHDGTLQTWAGDGTAEPTTPEPDGLAERVAKLAERVALDKGASFGAWNQLSGQVLSHDAALAELREQVGQALDWQWEYTRHCLPSRMEQAEKFAGVPDIFAPTPPAVPDAAESASSEAQWNLVVHAWNETDDEAPELMDTLAAERHAARAAVAKAVWLGLTPAPAGDDHPAITSILEERERQNAKWGTQRHSWPEWMSILAEEVGEAAREANQAHWLKVADQSFKAPKVQALREELVHSAAVAVQIIEHLDEWLGVHGSAGDDQGDTHEGEGELT